MKIGIDISQLAYPNTGVSNYLSALIENMLAVDHKNEYVLFFSSLRRNLKSHISNLKNTNSNLKIKTYKFPPTLLDILWNRLHVFPIEWLIGDVDVFITSDWVEPPVKKAKKITILYDLIMYKYPEETDQKIINAQKRKLQWVKKESKKILCISDATKKDAIEILGISEQKLHVTYPGI